MSIWEECAAYVAEPMDEDDAKNLSHEMRQAARETFFHDRDGFFAEDADSAACILLGHKPDPETGWNADDAHPVGWGGGNLCLATRHGSACTECESDDCDNQPPDRDAFWALFTGVTP